MVNPAMAETLRLEQMTPTVTALIEVRPLGLLFANANPVRRSVDIVPLWLMVPSTTSIFTSAMI